MTHCGLTLWIPEARVNRLPARDVEISVEFSDIFIFSLFKRLIKKKKKHLFYRI